MFPEHDPILQIGLLAIAAAAPVRLLARRRPVIRLVTRLMVFSGLTAVLVRSNVIPYRADAGGLSSLQDALTSLAKAAWWTSAALSLTGTVRAFIIFEHRPHEARLLQDLLVALIYVGAGLSIVAYAFGVPVGALIATSGVFAIILGLALQSTLNDLFSGIALNLGRPYAIGDWIVLKDGTEGRVIETNWRATHLIGGSNDLIILPNSSLAKLGMTNLSGPDRSHGVTLRVRLAPSVRPALVVETMREVLLSSTLILKSPPPSAQVASLDAQAIEIELGFHVADRSGASSARTEILDLVYRHAKAARLDLAPPPGTGVLPSRRASRPLPPRRASSLRLLDNLPLFAVLTEPEKQALAAAMDRRSYRESEVVAAQGTVLERLVLVRSGVLSVTCRDPDDGDEHELERLAPGDCFGERGILLGLEETGTVRALGRVVTYEIGRDILAPLMRDRPAMAEELEVILSRQSEAERRLAGSRNAGPLPPTTPGLAGRTRSLLGLPHDPPARTP